jgi:hypothetical protein
MGAKVISLKPQICCPQHLKRGYETGPKAFEGRAKLLENLFEVRTLNKKPLTDLLECARDRD